MQWCTSLVYCSNDNMQVYRTSVCESACAIANDEVTIRQIKQRKNHMYMLCKGVQRTSKSLPKVLPLTSWFHTLRDLCLEVSLVLPNSMWINVKVHTRLRGSSCLCITALVKNKHRSERLHKKWQHVQVFRDMATEWQTEFVKGGSSRSLCGWCQKLPGDGGSFLRTTLIQPHLLMRF